MVDELSTVETNREGLMGYKDLVKLPYLRMIHFEPALFPEPDTFMPERWLGDSRKASKKNLIPFSKGPRMCVGMNLSYMEAYVFLGNLFRRFDLELHDAGQDELRWRDYIALHLDDDVKISVRSLRN
ncbi:Isotrichodermin C-15 hydroxylase-like protein [Hapsidospora chrysogenum ATCC 11550]|uniref:Isotrichodermin C-15 hydroxylase-like protein n=1 Tax=Hapsidospora chrysogenum (strain ATCC 11550 / CBS 779.69 / DSM 880 / IAM 14645 / JCM 23072 / IMI 49137) TaxID=857340 RepID=A0A086T2S2_HAPC1|nr:Isotrichodermin C-15 hydroxylase-like protein [Hapsidospora chrysogenum ATCC 11550]